jgi:hypothetical protein
MDEVDTMTRLENVADEAAKMNRKARRAMARAAEQTGANLADTIEIAGRRGRKAARKAAKAARKTAKKAGTAAEPKPRRTGRRVMFVLGLGAVAAGVAYAVRASKQQATDSADDEMRDKLSTNGTAPQPRQQEMKGHVSNPN